MAKKQAINEESLQFTPAKVSWATARFIARPPSLAARGFLYLVIAAVIASVTYSVFFRVAVSVETRGKIATRAPAVPISTPIQFRVAQLHVAEGQTVSLGDLLLEGEGRLTDDQFAEISQQHGSLTDIITRQKTGRCKTCLKELVDLAPTAFRAETAGPTQELLARLRQSLLDFISQEESFGKRAIASSSERRRIQLAKGKLREIRRLGAEDQLSTQVDSLENEVAAAQSGLAERRQGLELQVAQARNRLEVQLSGLLDEISLRRSQEAITAPAAGVIAEMTVSGEGQLVAPGTPLMKIVRLDSGIQGILYVPNQEIAKIDPGMQVRVKLDALPEREYGAVMGTIESIPADVIKSDNPDQAVYEVPIVLEATSLVKDGESYDFRLGMTLTGLVIIKHESLFMRGMRKIFHFKEEILE